jgi:hypothetical protein
MLVSRDAWRGEATRPISQNPWLYSFNNPINSIDPSGSRPAGPEEIDDVRINRKAGYQYSCNCGWIDWAHAIARMEGRTSLAHTIHSRLAARVDWSAYPNWTGNRGVRIESSVKVGPLVIKIDDVAVVREASLGSHLNAIWAGIFVSHSEHVENVHGGYIGIGPSYYSEEDLPSNLIGLYIAKRMNEGATFDVALEEVTEACDVLTEAESLSVYENEYLSGDGFETGWRKWEARLVPISGSCQVCDLTRQWPARFSALRASASPSSRNGDWWWWEHPWVDGTTERETEVDGVIALRISPPPGSGP